ncbi:hypothetical protein OG365_03645 [Streptomyces sp. NBC_00853]|uniref:hypothetical protein n=1 Tax=Streptomyces sp. NBC_00853 TaxID=2903681 RepID=UPI003872AD9C|nr:hypothetical protein OG365_03645 [Streptomyces sp. NBC_00853]
MNDLVDLVDRVLGVPDPSAARPRLPSPFDPPRVLGTAFPGSGDGELPGPSAEHVARRATGDQDAPHRVEVPPRLPGSPARLLRGPARHTGVPQAVPPNAAPGEPAVRDTTPAGGGSPAEAQSDARAGGGQLSGQSAAAVPRAPTGIRDSRPAPRAATRAVEKGVVETGVLEKRPAPGRYLKASPDDARPLPHSPGTSGAAPGTGGESPHRIAPLPEETTVHITIGRLEIRSDTARPAPERAPARRPAREPSVPLEEYLRRRSGGGR